MNQSPVCIGLGQGGELKTVQIVRRGEPVLYRFYLRRLCPAYRHHSHILLLSLLLAILSGCARTLPSPQVPVIVKHLKNRNGVASPCRTTCTVCGDAHCYAFLSIQLYRLHLSISLYPPAKSVRRVGQHRRTTRHVRHTTANSPTVAPAPPRGSLTEPGAMMCGMCRKYGAGHGCVSGRIQRVLRQDEARSQSRPYILEHREAE